MAKASFWMAVLYDKDGYELGTRYADTRKDAMKEARYLASDTWAQRHETTHAALGSYRVAVMRDYATCIWDKLL